MGFQIIQQGNNINVIKDGDFLMSIKQTDFVFTETDKGFFTIHDAAVHNRVRSIKYADFQDINGAALTDKETVDDTLSALVSGGGGGSGSGGSTTINTTSLATRAKQDDLKASIDAILAKTDDPAIVAELENLKNGDADALTKLNELGQNTDELEAKNDALKAALDAEHLAEKQRDEALLTAVNTNDAATLAELEKQTAELKLISGKQSTDFQESKGKDDANDTIVSESITYPNGVRTVRYLKVSDGSEYTLTGNFVEFSSDQFDTQETFFRAITDGSGFSRGDIVKKTRIIKKSDGSVQSTSYTNLKTKDIILFTTVEDLESNFTVDTTPPTTRVTEEFFTRIDADPYTITGRIFKVYQSDDSQIWIDKNGQENDMPVVAGESIFNIHDQPKVYKRYEGANALPSPLVIEKDTIKYLNVWVASGSYTIQLDDQPPFTIDTESPIFTHNEEIVENSYVRQKITITTLTAGRIEMEYANVGGEAVQFEAGQVTSKFVVDPSLAVEVGGEVTEIGLPAYLASTDVLSKTTGSPVERSTVNGVEVLRSTSLFGGGTFASNPIPIDNSVFAIGSFFDFKRSGIGSYRSAFGCANPTIQIHFDPAGETIRIDTSGDLFELPYSNLDLSADELSGNDAVIFATTNIINGGNRDFEHKIYNAANPSGKVIHTTTKSLALAGNYTGSVIGLQWVTYLVADDINNESTVLDIIKQKSNIAW